MKKTFLRVMSFAVIAALVCIGCSDDGVEGRSPEVGEFVNMFVGGGARYTLSVNAMPPGSGTVSRNPESDAYKAGSKVAVKATPKEGYAFIGWSGTVSDANDAITVTMNGNMALTANFQEIRQYTLTAGVYPSDGGSVSRNPSQTNYTTGTTVTVTATAADGYTFTGWTGSTNETTESVTITMSSDMVLTANFQKIQYTLTTNVSPSGGGSVSRSPNQINYASGTSVTVTATAASDYTFTGWSGASTAANSVVTIIMDGNKTLTANFTLKGGTGGGGQTGRDTAKVPVRVNVDATITVMPPEWTSGVGAEKNVAANVVDTITILLQQGAGDENWWINAKAEGYYEVSRTFSPKAGANPLQNVTLSPVPVITYTLTVNTEPATGGGTVLRSPNQTSYNSGTSVTVTATAASGYTFTGWSGASSSTSSSVTITMNGDRTLTANFQESNNCGTDGTARSCKKVTIGGKRWMAENLNIETADSWCYDDNPANCEKYGRLYTWQAALTACPAGWHLPTRQEWVDLAKAAGGTDYYSGDGGTAGRALKSTSGWNSYQGVSGNGDDTYGFSALPGGIRYSDGHFGNVGGYGRWWTATENSSGSAYYRFMAYYSDGVGQNVYTKEYGNSVRCVED